MIPHALKKLEERTGSLGKHAFLRVNMRLPQLPRNCRPVPTAPENHLKRLHNTMRCTQ